MICDRLVAMLQIGDLLKTPNGSVYEVLEIWKNGSIVLYDFSYHDQFLLTKDLQGRLIRYVEAEKK